MTTLLTHYLRAVRLYLPAGPKTDDILTELEEHLRSRIEEAEEDVRRPLTDRELSALLTGYGNPMQVAERYGASRRSVAFGWQIIGPEVFPLYVRVLALNWLLTVAVLAVGPRVVGWPNLTMAGAVRPLVTQLILVTTIFAVIDWFQRQSRLRAETNWLFPPFPLQAIPRWQSLTGLLLFSLLTVWWVLVPVMPALAFGRAADRLVLTPSWSVLYWPVLLLLTIGVVQRAATLRHPEWNMLQAVTRLLTNVSCLALLYPFAMNFPYVQVADASRGAADAERLARGINSGLWWATLGSISFYWLINAAFHAWLCAQHVRYRRRRRRQEPVPDDTPARLRAVK